MNRGVETRRNGTVVNRRDFLQSALPAVASWLLFRTFVQHDAFAQDIGVSPARWIRDLHEMTGDLRGQKISPLVWQERIEALYGTIPLAELLQAIDFERLTAEFVYPERGVHTQEVNFPDLEGLDRLAFHGKIFGMRRHRAIIPHGHRNMASCHYVLHGELHLRQYDKLDEDDTHMVIVPTRDEIGTPGSYSTISDDRDNVHWLVARTETAFTFDVIALDIAGRPWEVHNVDPRKAVPAGGGGLRVPKLDVSAALEAYGYETHHPDGQG